MREMVSRKQMVITSLVPKGSLSGKALTLQPIQIRDNEKDKIGLRLLRIQL